MIYSMSNIYTLMFYLFIYLISSLFFKISEKFEEKYIWLLTLLAPTILAAFRWNVGTDFSTYLHLLNTLKNISFAEWIKDFNFFGDVPIGLFLVIKIANLFSADKVVFFGIFAILSLAPILLFLKNQKKEFDASLALFIYLLTLFSSGLNIMKQGVAAAFIIFSLQYVFEKNIIKFSISIFFACLFHPTAIISFIIYFIINKNKCVDNWRKIIFSLISILLPICMDVILPLFGERYGNYADMSIENGGSNKSFFLKLIWLLIYLIFRKKLIEKNKMNELLIMMFLIGTVFESLGFVSIYGKRIAMYFSCSNFLLMSQLPFVFREEDKKIVKFIIALYSVLLFTYTYVVLEQSGICPYNYIVE